MGKDKKLPKLLIWLKIAFFAIGNERLSEHGTNQKKETSDTYRVDFTVVILINATTLMHKSTVNTNNFGINILDKKYQKQNILRFFRRL